VCIGGVDTDPMDNPFVPAGWTATAGLAGRDDGSRNSFVATRAAASEVGVATGTAQFEINTGDTAVCVGFVVNSPLVADGRTALAVAGADVTLNVDTDYGWQFRIQNTGGVADDDYKVQRKLNAGAWGDVTSSSTVVKASATADFANGADVPEYIKGTGTYVSDNNAALDTTGALTLTAALPASSSFEGHLNFQIVSGDVVNGDAIQLKVVYGTGSDLEAYTDTPTITVSEASAYTDCPFIQNFVPYQDRVEVVGY